MKIYTWLNKDLDQKSGACKLLFALVWAMGGRKQLEERGSTPMFPDMLSPLSVLAQQ